MNEQDRELLREMVDRYHKQAQTLQLYGLKCADMSRDELLAALAMVVSRYVPLVPPLRGEPYGPSCLSEQK